MKKVKTLYLYSSYTGKCLNFKGFTPIIGRNLNNIGITLIFAEKSRIFKMCKI